MNTLTVITAKTLSHAMGVSESTTKRYLEDIKQEYEIKTVLLCHVRQYFKVPDLESDSKRVKKA